MYKIVTTFFLKFKVLPTPENLHVGDVEGAYAACWIKEKNPQTAFWKCCFFISKFDWTIVETEIYPTEVCEDDFAQKDIGLEQFRKAQLDGISIFYTAWARDGKSTIGPITQSASHRFNTNKYLNGQKKLKNSKRCLHFDAGSDCNGVINAHSIQKNGCLSSIQVNGKVYAISKDLSDLKSHGGRAILKKQGITKQVSTFFGFCGFHDNALFELIDNNPLIPTDEQVVLYAYRSICRELFVKENSYNLMQSQIEKQTLNHALVKLFEGMTVGTKFGLDNLRIEKQKYDLMLKNENYHQIRYALFISSENPCLVFSGLFYPDFDFMGRSLQDLSNTTNELNLLTFCSAKMEYGWGFLFAWHETSSLACNEFIKSLATRVYENTAIEDFLFRLVVSNCENFAASPTWWESLSNTERDAVEEQISNMADIFSLTQSNYLSEGISGVCPWKFESVITNME
ncbi:hypothetical protein JCM12294_36480 [Desulfocicer niacini]